MQCPKCKSDIQSQNTAEIVFRCGTSITVDGVYDGQIYEYKDCVRNQVKNLEKELNQIYRIIEGNQNKNKVAIYGGAFDPITTAHYKTIQALKNVADEVWMLPCYSHLFDKNMTDASQRLHMCQMMADEESGVKVCDYEYGLEEAVTSYEVLRGLADLHPDNEFHFVMGGDNLSSLAKWKHHQELQEQFGIIAFERVGYDLSQIDKSQFKNLRILPSPCDNIAISSTRVRKIIKEGYGKDIAWKSKLREQLKNLIPDGLVEYILNNRLYHEN